MASWQSQAIMIVPTYNERENLAKLVARLRSLPGDVHVLVVDDNSPDGTGAIADAIAASDESVHVLHREGKLGLGTAYRAGFHYALEHGFQYICTMDADFSHSPESLPALLDKAASGYDLVIGSRYVRGRCSGWLPGPAQVHLLFGQLAGAHDLWAWRHATARRASAATAARCWKPSTSTPSLAAATAS